MSHLLEEQLQKKYISTKESANLLNISLGTVQKMVESGELLAWKTRGGHRRILVSSLQTILRRCDHLFQQLNQKKPVILGFHRSLNHHENLSSIVSRFQIPFDLEMSLNYHEGLMSAVEIKPKIIFLDSRLPAVEKILIIFYLAQNSQTIRIPLLVNQKFMRLNEQAISLTGEGSDFLIPYLFKNQEMELSPDCIFNHPKLVEYEDDYFESHPDLNYSYFESIIYEQAGLEIE
jgi:excisionase family DNA binding protein